MCRCWAQALACSLCDVREKGREIRRAAAPPPDSPAATDDWYVHAARSLEFSPIYSPLRAGLISLTSLSPIYTPRKTRAGEQEEQVDVGLGSASRQALLLLDCCRKGRAFSEMSNAESRRALRGEGERILDVVSEALMPRQWAELLMNALEGAAAEGDRGLAMKLVGAGARIGLALHSAVRGGHGELMNDLL